MKHKMKRNLHAPTLSKINFIGKVTLATDEVYN